MSDVVQSFKNAVTEGLADGNIGVLQALDWLRVINTDVKVKVLQDPMVLDQIQQLFRCIKELELTLGKAGVDYEKP